MPAHALPPDRSGVLAEARNPRSAGLHQRDIAGILAQCAEEDASVIAACAAATPALAAFIAAVEPGFLAGGRLVYLGAGTSGRLGVLDASEMPPTFQLPPDRIIGLIAGGDRALRLPGEGAEDDPAGALPDLQALRLGPGDAVLGIAAGGTTPYVRGALAWAASLPQPPQLGLLSCSPCSSPAPGVHLIVAPTGPELICGSTRLKAGTATKLLLNRLSTTLMIRDGRVHDDLMIGLRASNAKLRDRAARIIAALSGCDRAEAFARLAAAGGDLRAALAAQAGK